VREKKMVDVRLTPKGELIAKVAGCFDENVGSFIASDTQ